MLVLLVLDLALLILLLLIDLLLLLALDVTLLLQLILDLALLILLLLVDLLLLLALDLTLLILLLLNLLLLLAFDLKLLVLLLLLDSTLLSIVAGAAAILVLEGVIIGHDMGADAQTQQTQPRQLPDARFHAFLTRTRVDVNKTVIVARRSAYFIRTQRKGGLIGPLGILRPGATLVKSAHLIRLVDCM
ncbi:hypothetical protein PSCICG_37500 [Pseudomonas cichorii]|nr:hypothetical protein PSCICG_37500 [Pseudomonas cichorii]